MSIADIYMCIEFIIVIVKEKSVMERSIRVGLRTSSRDIFTKVSRLGVSKLYTRHQSSRYTRLQVGGFVLLLLFLVNFSPKSTEGIHEALPAILKV